MDFMSPAHKYNSVHSLSRNGASNNNISNMQQHQSSFEVWNNFFLSAGIPGSVSNEYAMKFSQHRIRIDMLQEISKDILIDMGIKAMGDIIAILRHAKSICAQNELKPSGVAKSLTTSNQFVPHSAIAPNPSISNDSSYKMPNIKNLELAPAASRGVVGNKIQSRLNLRSGAVIASSSHNGISDNKRNSSSISSSLAKRLAPPPVDRKLNLDLAEKTLTVHYPSRAAIAKAAQRISGSEAHSISTQRVSTSSSSIKSRLGSVRSGSAKFESNSGNNIRIKNDNQISKHNNKAISNSRPTSRDIPSNTRRPEARHTSHKTISSHASSTDRSANSRPKSTVFSRLGQSVR